MESKYEYNFHPTPDMTISWTDEEIADCWTTLALDALEARSNADKAEMEHKRKLEVLYAFLACLSSEQKQQLEIYKEMNGFI